MLQWTTFAGPYNENRQEDEFSKWEQIKSYRVPLRLALDSVKTEAGRSRRNVFVFVDTQVLSPDDIKDILTKLATKYTDPTTLEITMYSDKEMLQRAINLYRKPVRLFPSMPPDELEKRQEEIERSVEGIFPRRSGYIRSSFVRTYEGEEYIRYSPDPNKEDIVVIRLNRGRS
jgi:hypothetical protein